MGIESRGYIRDADDRSWRGQSRLADYSMVTLLIVVNFVIFLVDQFTPARGGLSDWMALNSDLISRPWQVYTLVTYGFAHARLDTSTGFWHIAGNMLALFFLGKRIEEHYGRWEFLRVYLASIVFSGLFWLVITLLRGREATCVGASGAVVTIVMLFALNFPRQTLNIWGVLPVPAWLVGTMLVVSNLMGAFTPGSRVAFEAHLGGALFAAIYFFGKLNFGEWADSFSLGWKIRRSKLKVHAPNEDPKWEKLQAEGDRILSKIAESGADSLTRAEQKTLTRYSESLRKRRR